MALMVPDPDLISKGLLTAVPSTMPDIGAWGTAGMGCHH